LINAAFRSSISVAADVVFWLTGAGVPLTAEALAFSLELAAAVGGSTEPVVVIVVVVVVVTIVDVNN
jgi:hypothetical protein